MNKVHVASALALMLGASAAHSQQFFQPAQQFLTPYQTTGIAVGDINGDGLKDVVATSCSCGYGTTPQLYVYLQTASRTINPTPVTYVPNGSGGSVSIGDVTGDGRNDLLMRGGYGFEVVPQGAAGTLEPSITYPSSYAELARIGDLNGDGRLDAIGLELSIDGHINSEDAAILYQNPAGSFDAQVLVPLPHGYNDDIEVNDINGDGRADVVVVNAFNEPPISIIYQTAAGTMSAPVQLGIAPGVLANNVAVGDVDGDGRKDLVVGFAAWEPTAHLAVFHQNADGSFAAPVISDVATSLTSLEIADVDRDGRADVLLLHQSTLGVVLQGTGGSLKPEVLVALPPAGGHYQHGFVASDINGDGAVDVAYTQVGSQGAVTVLFGVPPVTNRPPVAVADRATLKCDDTLAIAVLANDSDPDGDAIALTGVSQPAHGSARVLANGKVLYVPKRRFRGTDTFTYSISDGRGGSASATVTVIVR